MISNLDSIEDNVHKQVAVPKQIMLDLITEIRALRKVADAAVEISKRNFEYGIYADEPLEHNTRLRNLTNALESWRKGSDQDDV